MEESKIKQPKSCHECTNQGISDITIFPSICKINYLFFQCGGKLGYKKEEKN